MELTTQLVGLDKVTGDLNAMIERADDLSRPLRWLGDYHVRKAAGILRTGERGIRMRTDPAGLAASLTYQASTHTLQIGSNKGYAAAQQFGPAGGFFESNRPGGYLAIPIADNLGAKRKAKYQSPNDVEDGFFFKSKKGTLLFGRRVEGKSPSSRGPGNRKKAMKPPGIELLFVLKERVPGHPHGYVSHDPKDQQFWDSLVGKWILTGKR